MPFHTWFCIDGVVLNPDKSKAILLGICHRADGYSNLATVNIARCQIPLADHIKILGVTLDKNLFMDNYVNSVGKSVPYHIRALQHAVYPCTTACRSCIYEDVAKMVACALVGSHLDSANSVLYGTTKKTFLNYRKHKTLDVLLLVLSSPVRVLFSNSSIGSPLNTALTSR